MTLGGLLEGLSDVGSSKGHLVSGRTNHLTLVWICLYIQHESQWMIYMCGYGDYFTLVKWEIRSGDELQVTKAARNLESYLSQSQIIKMKGVQYFRGLS